MRPARATLLTALLLASGGCAVTAAAGWQAQLADEIGAAQGVVCDRSALVVPAADADPAVGDRLVYDVRLDDGERTRVWRLDLEVAAVERARVVFWRGVQEFELRVQSPESQFREAAARLAAPVDWDDLAEEQPVAHLLVTAFDAAGTEASRGESEVIVRRLREGLLPACRAGERQRGPMTGRVAAGRAAPMLTLDDAAYHDVGEVGKGVAACELFFDVLRQNPVTRQILFEVLALPSLWSILTNWGVRVAFEVDFFAAERVDPARFPGEQRELWSVPLTLLLNGQPSLLAQVVVGPAGSPDGVGAGVYAIVARHPSDASRRLTVTLVASRRGP